MEKEVNPELEIKGVDIAVSAMNSALAIIPIIGPLMGELVGVVIPNQRFDRLIKFSKQLERKLGKMDQSVLKLALENENFTDLMEESLRQAARSLSDERREYIASVISNSLTPENIDFIESKHILKILGEINDIEVIWLRFYCCPRISGDNEFREKHKNVIKFQRASIGAPQKILDKSTFQESYQDHLIQLGLLKPQYETFEIDRSKRIPITDNFSGGLKISNYSITPLGIIVLRQIDLYCED